MTRITEVQAASIFVRSKLPATDYVANPYIGCAYGCAYCYASFMTRQAGEPLDAWGDFVSVKVNAAALARAEVARMRPPFRTRSVMLSSVTDPYQGVESRYRLTRGILEALAAAGWTGQVRLLTKSPLVTRDIDVLARLPQPDVGMTVTTTDDLVSHRLEGRAPPPSARLRALEQLTAAGLPTYVFVGPLLPHFRFEPEKLDYLFERIAATGVRRVLVEHINLSGPIRRRVLPELESAEEQASYLGARTEDHRAVLDQVVAGMLTRHGLTLRLGRVLRHQHRTRENSAGPDSLL
jgi:DNA repair photolyase